jgi:hypothetical protein
LTLVFLSSRYFLCSSFFLLKSIALHLPPNVHRYRVQDILIMPVQRIPRYFMLLETYAAVMGPTDPDYPAVQWESLTFCFFSYSETLGRTAARRCRNLTTLINDRKRYADSIEHVYILAQKVVSAEEVPPNESSCFLLVTDKRFSANRNSRKAVFIGKRSCRSYPRKASVEGVRFIHRLDLPFSEGFPYQYAVFSALCR